MHRRDPRLAQLQWDDVRLFLALCRSRTLGEAAQALGVDGSTVSRRLAALEESLGASLFDRGRSGVAATAAADALLPVAEEIEHGMARFAGAAEALERDVSGLVRVACPPDAAEVLIAPALPALFARHPGLRIELQAGEALVDVGRRAADIALRIVRPERGDLIVRKLPAVRWVLAAAPELAEVLAPVRRWRDVPWIACGDALAHVPAARWVRAHGGDEAVLRTDSVRLQIAAVEAGVGAALVPAASVRHYGLVEVEVAPALWEKTSPWPEDALYLLTHRSLRRVPRVNAVWELLIERVEAVLGGD
ncbi:MAG TPA: LysR family transcriptional regulator [Polyangiaceae bacterium LLY-WYZ-15_(1-7)]|nr:LysR family transcriptional regulator [Myxococcales bacterium]MAT25504.1 LysR family transcriptional regulator [Sandaracinus sp.]HJL00354.1 LysR family transcriptional regulator [Polyangiaceae bacterium LLY-WYZ-15_(1-7)]MBJ72081.1 LysR family transcriptional regulator [Sandaracinus sp.]HJL09357.1 LysR family transcriptional regulator [Polyangiaceae bacterium LLY-WYZ-15_(1-7)]